MKELRVFSLFALVLLLVASGVSCKKNKVVVTSPKESTQLTQPYADSTKVDNDLNGTTLPTTASSDSTVTINSTPSNNEKFATFEIIKSNTTTRKDKGQTLFVLIPAINLDKLEELNYVIRVKNLIKQIVVFEKRPENISILVFDDLATLEKVFIQIEPTDLDIASHYIARYVASPSEETYRNTLHIFPFAPDSNPVIKAQTDIIMFNPYEW